MRHYTFTDRLYRSDVATHVVSVTATSQKLDLSPASKVLYLRNDGANNAYLAFDKDTATTSDFKLAAADGLVKIEVQCEKIALVCAATQTTTVRISSNY